MLISKPSLCGFQSIDTDCIEYASALDYYFISPYFEAFEHIGAKDIADWNISGISALGNQYSSDPWDVVARIKRMPATAKIDFKPGGKVHRLWCRWNANITQIACAITRWNIQAAAKGNCKVGPAIGGTDSGNLATATAM